MPVAAGSGATISAQAVRGAVEAGSALAEVAAGPAGASLCVLPLQETPFELLLLMQLCTLTADAQLARAACTCFFKSE